MRLFFTLSILISSLYAKGTDPYQELLKKYPEYVGRLGDYTKGEIEIVSDPKKIQEISELQKKRFQKLGLSEEEAIEASRIGIISDDIYWIFIRDAVIFPTGAEGSYNRVIPKSGFKDGTPCVAILPVLPDGRIVLNVTFRHATRSWELEVPRGSKKAEESLEKAATRELEEETGFSIERQVFVGNVAPDTGSMGSCVATYIAFVGKRGVPNQDYSEAILANEAFSLTEIKEALSLGYIERVIRGKKTRIWVRDSFLTYLLYQGENQKII